jgi:hypothetical protein
MEKYASSDWHQLNNPTTDNLNVASRTEFLNKFANTIADGLQAGGAKKGKAAKAKKAAPAKAKKAAPAKAKKEAPAKAKKAAYKRTTTKVKMPDGKKKTIYVNSETGEKRIRKITMRNGKKCASYVKLPKMKGGGDGVDICCVKKFLTNCGGDLDACKFTDAQKTECGEKIGTACANHLCLTINKTNANKTCNA